MVLNYAISYYQKHQDSPVDAWFSIDPKLVTNHFVVVYVIISAQYANPANTNPINVHRNFLQLTAKNKSPPHN